MERHYKQVLEKYLKIFPCVAILGARQCGKTTFLSQLPSGFRVFDIEKDSDLELVSRDPDLFLRLYPHTIAIDEAQLLPKLFPALRVAIDADRSRMGRFVLTGSSSPRLLGSLSESLAGRIGLIEMAPFSAGEAYGLGLGAFLSWFASPKENPRPELFGKPRLTVSQSHEYWFRGGYPEPWVRNDPIVTKAWLEGYTQTYLQRDIARYFPRIDSERFRRFLRTLSAMSGTVINVAELARSLGVSQPTAADYLEIANGTFIWRSLPAFGKKPIARLVRHPKGYLRDSGVLHHFLHIRDTDHLLTHPALGGSWEGMVIEQILRGLQALDVVVEASYYRTRTGSEVDLILEGDFGLVPIEIKHSQRLSARELAGLKQFMQERDCAWGFVITNGESPGWLDEKIVEVPFGCL